MQNRLWLTSEKAKIVVVKESSSQQLLGRICKHRTSFLLHFSLFYFIISSIFFYFVFFFIFFLFLFFSFFVPFLSFSLFFSKFVKLFFDNWLMQNSAFTIIRIKKKVFPLNCIQRDQTQHTVLINYVTPNFASYETHLSHLKENPRFYLQLCRENYIWQVIIFWWVIIL